MVIRLRATELTASEKNQIAQILLVNSNNKGDIKWGKVKELASSYEVSRRTIQNVWKAAKTQQLVGEPIFFKSNKKGIVHNMTKKVELDEEMLKAIPFQKRTTMRRLAKELNCSKSTVGRWVKSGQIEPHTNAIKPTLTAANKLQRLKYSLKALQFDRLNNKLKFETMHNVVHIDEKWFYMTRASERFYKAKDEVEPHRTCKSKRYIPKIMFMCAVSRPIFSSNGEVLFDGKIGIFPFKCMEPAKRNSKNRVKGTMVTKPIHSITKQVTKECLLTKEKLSAIKAKWPTNASKHILIQQDNAKPHISNLDEDWRAAASTDGWDIHLVCQPPNSPDTNVNDLGWFRAIQSLQVDTASYNVEQLVKNVILSFERLEAVSLNNAFLSLQNCMQEIMVVKGGNNYKLPHMDKWKLIRQDKLPLVLEVEEQLVRDCIDYLVHEGQIEGDTLDLEEALSKL